MFNMHVLLLTFLPTTCCPHFLLKLISVLVCKNKETRWGKKLYILILKTNILLLMTYEAMLYMWNILETLLTESYDCFGRTNFKLRGEGEGEGEGDACCACFQWLSSETNKFLKIKMSFSQAYIDVVRSSKMILTFIE